MVGTRPLVIGYVLTNFALPTGLKAEDLWTRWSAPGRPGPPANRVALELEPGETFGPMNSLQLPIAVSQHWYSEPLNSGALGYHWGFLRFHNADYQVTYWIGPDAPAADRAAVLRALKSIRPAR